MSNQEHQLTVHKGPKVGQVFYLDTRSLIIGRDPMSDIIINDPEVSRQHARISQTESGLQIEDLGSTNGTFIEGQRLKSEPVNLEPGQSIGMGSGVRLIYEIVSERTSQVDTMIDPAQPWPVEEQDTPEKLEINPASEALADQTPEPDFPSPFGEPEPASFEPEPSSFEPEPLDYEEPPDYGSPMPPPDAPNSNKQRNAAIAVGAILLLCCCCSFIGFMYQWGGDLMLDYFGIVP